MPFQIHGFTDFFFFIFTMSWYSRFHIQSFIENWFSYSLFHENAFSYSWVHGHLSWLFINSWPFDFQIHHFIHKKIRFQIQIWTICIVNFKFPESQHRTALQTWPSSKLHMAHGFFRHPCFQTQGFMDFLWGFHSSHDFCIFIFMDFMIFYFHTHGIRTLLTLTVKKREIKLTFIWAIWTIFTMHWMNCKLRLFPISITWQTKNSRNSILLYPVIFGSIWYPSVFLCYYFGLKKKIPWPRIRAQRKQGAPPKVPTRINCYD